MNNTPDLRQATEPARRPLGPRSGPRLTDSVGTLARFRHERRDWYLAYGAHSRPIDERDAVIETLRGTIEILVAQLDEVDA